MTFFNGCFASNVLLRSIFKNDTFCLNFTHLNIGSILPKIDELRDIFVNSNTHIIAVSETWLKSHISNKSVEITGYKLLRADRMFRRGGGVALYVSTKLKTRIVSTSFTGVRELFKSNYLFIEITFPDSVILFGVTYKPPATDELPILDNILSQLIPKYDDVVLMGDFNENTLSSPPKAQTSRFLQAFNRHSLQLISNIPTHFYPSSSSLIDLTFTNNIRNVLTYTQLDTSLSRHDILVCRYLCTSPIGSELPKYCRKIKLINVENLLHDAVSISMPWNIVYDALSCDSMVNAFEGLALDLLDRHAPMVLVKPLNKNNQPWFDSRVQLAIDERNIAKRMWKNNRSLRNHNEFIRLRNKAARIIKTTKIAYYAPRLNDKLPSRVLWKNLKSIGISSTENHLPPFSNYQFNNYLLSSVPNSACPSRYSDIPISQPRHCP